MSSNLYDDSQLLAPDFDENAFLRHILQEGGQTTGGFDMEQQRLTRCIERADQELLNVVESHHEPLIQHVESLRDAGRSLERITSSVDSVSSSLQRLKHTVTDPCTTLQRNLNSLNNVTDALELTRRMQRFTGLIEKLVATGWTSTKSNPKQHNPNTLEPTRAARLLREIEEVSSPSEGDVDLSGIELYDKNVKLVQEATVALRQRARKMFDAAVSAGNATDLGLALQCFSSLGELPKVLRDKIAEIQRETLRFLVTELDAQNLQGLANGEKTTSSVLSTGGASAAGSTSGGAGNSFRPADLTMNHLDGVFQKIALQFKSVGVMWRCILRRKDAISQKPFVEDIPSSSRRDATIALEQLWARILTELKQLLRKATKTAPTFNAILIGELGRYSRSARAFTENLVDSYEACFGGESCSALGGITTVTEALAGTTHALTGLTGNASSASEAASAANSSSTSSAAMMAGGGGLFRVTSRKFLDIWIDDIFSELQERFISHVDERHNKALQTLLAKMKSAMPSSKSVSAGGGTGVGGGGGGAGTNAPTKETLSNALPHDQLMDVATLGGGQGGGKTHMSGVGAGGGGGAGSGGVPPAANIFDAPVRAFMKAMLQDLTAHRQSEYVLSLVLASMSKNIVALHRRILDLADKCPVPSYFSIQQTVTASLLFNICLANMCTTMIVEVNAALASLPSSAASASSASSILSPNSTSAWTGSSSSTLHARQQQQAGGGSGKNEHNGGGLSSAAAASAQAQGEIRSIMQSRLVPFTEKVIQPFFSSATVVLLRQADDTFSQKAYKNITELVPQNHSTSSSSSNNSRFSPHSSPLLTSSTTGVGSTTSSGTSSSSYTVAKDVVNLNQRVVHFCTRFAHLFDRKTSSLDNQLMKLVERLLVRAVVRSFMLRDLTPIAVQQLSIDLEAVPDILCVLYPTETLGHILAEYRRCVKAMSLTSLSELATFVGVVVASPPPSSASTSISTASSSRTHVLHPVLALMAAMQRTPSDTVISLWTALRVTEADFVKRIEEIVLTSLTLTPLSASAAASTTSTHSAASTTSPSLTSPITTAATKKDQSSSMVDIWEAADKAAGDIPSNLPNKVGGGGGAAGDYFNNHGGPDDGPEQADDDDDGSTKAKKKDNAEKDHDQADGGQYLRNVVESLKSVMSSSSS